MKPPSSVLNSPNLYLIKLINKKYLWKKDYPVINGKKQVDLKASINFSSSSSSAVISLFFNL